MVADSRSFLSFTRHEYFRRILCNVLGADMAAGLLPRDFDLVGALVEDVCFRNAESFFGFELPDRRGEAAKRASVGSARAGAGLSPVKLKAQDQDLHLGNGGGTLAKPCMVRLDLPLDGLT